MKRVKIFLVFIFAFFLFSFNFVFAATFTPPTSSPPNGNVDTPLNVSPSAQIKSGGIVVGAGLDDAQVSPVPVGLNVLHGRVGIGTGVTAPASKLEVAGDITATGFCFKSGGCLSLAGGGGTVSGAGVSNFIAKWTSQGTLGLTPIYANDNSVGIGNYINDTNPPTGLLQLNDSSTTVDVLSRPMLKITRPNPLSGIAGMDRKNAGLYILTKDYPLNVDVYDAASGGLRSAFTVAGDGKVGINKPSPLATLDVDGTISANNLYLARGGWSINDTAGDGQWLKLGSGAGGSSGGLDILNLKVGGLSTFANNVGVTGAATVSGDVTGARFCFGGTATCLTSTSIQPGVSSIASTDSYINVSPTTGNAQISLGINPLVDYLKTIFQIKVAPPNTNYACNAGYALTSVNSDGTYTCDVLGGAGSVIGPGTTGKLSKFTSSNTIGDSVIAENNSNIGIGVTPLGTSQTKLDVQSPSGFLGISGYANNGVYGKSNSAVSGSYGVYGEDSGLGSGSYGVFGSSHTSGGAAGVLGQADGGSGASAGLFRYTGTDGYALQTNSGHVYLGGRTGIGYDPRGVWVNDSNNQPLKLRIGGSVGANLYCDESGLNCLNPASPAAANYWTYDSNTKAIYNNNNTNLGPVGIGRQPVLNTVNKLDVLTNNGETYAIKGESNYPSGAGVYGLGSNDNTAFGVYGTAIGSAPGPTDKIVGGFFSAQGGALSSGKGYALQTGTGLVQFGGPSPTGIVGIGTAPASWATDASRNSLQLLIRGNVGASAYCQEDGRNCADIAKPQVEYWDLNTATGDIFNTNSPRMVGIGTMTPGYDLDIQGSLWPGEICLAHESPGTYTYNDADGNPISTTVPAIECAQSWQQVRYIITSSPQS